MLIAVDDPIGLSNGGTCTGEMLLGSHGRDTGELANVIAKGRDESRPDCQTFAASPAEPEDVPWPVRSTITRMRRSWLPVEKPNLFQAIRAKRAQVQEQGVKLIDLSIGEPRGPALLSARKAASAAIMSENEEIHRYQYNATPGIPGFAKDFVEFSVRHKIGQKDVFFLPIPGIKRMLGLLAFLHALCGMRGHRIQVEGTGRRLRRSGCVLHS